MEDEIYFFVSYSVVIVSYTVVIVSYTVVIVSYTVVIVSYTVVIVSYTVVVVVILKKNKQSWFVVAQFIKKLYAPYTILFYMITG